MKTFDPAVRYMKTPRPRNARKPFFKRAWEKMRKIDWKWILEFLKVIVALKRLFG